MSARLIKIKKVWQHATKPFNFLHIDPTKVFCYLTWKRLRSDPRGTYEVSFALYGFREYFNHQKLTISISPVFKVLIVQA